MKSETGNTILGVAFFVFAGTIVWKYFDLLKTAMK